MDDTFNSVNIELIIIILECNGTYRNWLDNEGMFVMCGLE